MLISSLVPDANVLLALEPSEVGAVMLEYFNSLPPHENHGLVGAQTCTSGDNLKAYPASKRDEIERAFSEGWAWLRSQCLIAGRPGDQYNNWFFVTRKGKQLRTRAAVEDYRRASAFPRDLLHPIIAAKTEPAFMRGRYDSAVFEGFKEVEVAVRTVSRLSESDYGTDLMRKAFHETTGPLTDSKSQISERQALAHLFAGAIGSYKNPHSHRNVSIDARQAVEMLVLASHLMTIVEARVAGKKIRKR